MRGYQVDDTVSGIITEGGPDYVDKRQTLINPGGQERPLDATDNRLARQIIYADGAGTNPNDPLPSNSHPAGTLIDPPEQGQGRPRAGQQVM